MILGAHHTYCQCIRHLRILESLDRMKDVLCLARLGLVLRGLVCLGLVSYAFASAASLGKPWILCKGKANLGKLQARRGIAWPGQARRGHTWSRRASLGQAWPCGLARLRRSPNGYHHCHIVSYQCTPLPGHDVTDGNGLPWRILWLHHGDHGIPSEE